MGQTTEIHILNRKVRLLQPAQGFRTSMDSVLLAAACPARKVDTLLDLGCGVGGAGFAVLWREPEVYLSGIDINEEYIRIARENSALNGKVNQCHFQVKDISDLRISDPKQRFDHVIINPPFYKEGAHTVSPHPGLAAARGHVSGKADLDQWITCAFHALKSKGSLTLIHQAERTDEIIRFLGTRFGRTELIPIYSKQDEPARRVIFRTVKDRRSPFTLHRPVVMHDEGGGESEEAKRLLREGVSFDTLYKETQS